MLLLLFSANPPIADAENIEGTYTESENWQGVFGTGEVVVTGSISGQAVIVRQSERLLLTGSIDFQPPSKMMLFESELKPIDNNRYTFSFVDSWDNVSRGSIVPDHKGLTLNLEVLKQSNLGARVSGLYGSYHLTKVSKQSDDFDN